MRYGAALFGVAAGILVRWVLEAWLPNRFGFLTVFGAIAFAVWYGRWKPALLALVLGYVGVEFFFFPSSRFLVFDTTWLVELVGYLFSGGLIIGLGELMHRAKDRAEAEAVQRQLAEQEQARQAELLATTLASIGDAVISTNMRGEITFLNAEAERLTGWKTDEANGKPLPVVFRIINEKTRKPSQNPVEVVLRTGKTVGLANHTLLITKDGTEVPIDDSAAPIRLADGSITGVILVFRDFTEQKKAQDTFARLAAIVEHSRDAIFTKDLRGRIATWNASAERLFGYSMEEVVGKPISILYPADRKHEEDHVMAHMHEGKPIELLETIRIAKGGRHIPVWISTSPIRDADGEIVGASKIVHDISDLAATQKELQETLARFESLVTYAPVMIGMFDMDLRYVSVNDRAIEVHGLSKEAHLGKRMSELLPGIGERVEEYLRQVRDTGKPIVRAEISGEIPSKPGERRHWIGNYYPVKGPNGNLLGIGVISLEVTEQKKAEVALHAAHEQLASRALHLETLVQQRTARLNEMVGDLEAFSYSIVHDMRGPLRAMNSFTQLLEEECGRVSPTAENYMKRIRTATVRMDRLIQDGLNYSRLMRAELPLVPLDAAELVQGIIETYPSLQPPLACIEVEGHFPPVKANEATLTQCVSNLLGNAAKFVAPGVQPHVRVSAEKRGNFVRLNFKDNGIGIPIGAHERIFQIFQRLDNNHEGTGIGLAIVKKAAERMGGSVGVESEPDKGSTFWLELPAAEEEASNAA